MSVIQRTRSIFERLTGTGRPPPSKFNPHRPASRPREAAEPGVSQPSPWGPIRLQDAQGTGRAEGIAASSTYWPILAVFVASAAMGLAILYWDRIATAVNSGSVGPIVSLLGLLVPTFWIMFKVHRAQHWVAGKLLEIASFRPPAANDKSGEGQAQLEQSAGRGMLTMFLITMVVTFGFPMFDRILDKIGIVDWPLVNLLPLTAVIALLWHRYGSPPWAKRL